MPRGKNSLKNLLTFVQDGLNEGAAVLFGVNPNGEFKVVLQKGQDRKEMAVKINPMIAAAARMLKGAQINDFSA